MAPWRPFERRPPPRRGPTSASSSASRRQPSSSASHGISATSSSPAASFPRFAWDGASSSRGPLSSPWSAPPRQLPESGAQHRQARRLRRGAPPRRLWEYSTGCGENAGPRERPTEGATPAVKDLPARPDFTLNSGSSVRAYSRGPSKNCTPAPASAKGLQGLDSGSGRFERGSACAEQPAENAGRVGVGALEEVGVDVQCRRGIGVTEPSGDCLHRNPRDEHPGGGEVS